MKKLHLLLIAVFIFALTNANAQIDQNSVMIGGGLAASSTEGSTDQTDSESTNNFLINLNPKIGYFFIDNFAAGLGIEYTYNTEDSDGNVTTSDLLAGPFGRDYFPLGESSAFFAELNVVFGSTNIDDEQQDVSTSLFGLGIGPGFTIFANESIGIEGIVRYNYITGSTDIDGNSVGLTINEFDFLVGVQFYLN